MSATKETPTTSRPELVHTLRQILEREKEWLTAIKNQPQQELKSLATYLSEHISILSDSLDAFSTGRYVSFASTDQDVVDSVNANLASYVDFALASHLRACASFNSGLKARGITTVRLRPVNLS